jgi:hypothetical protein
MSMSRVLIMEAQSTWRPRATLIKTQRFHRAARAAGTGVG